MSPFLYFEPVLDGYVCGMVSGLWRTCYSYVPSGMPYVDCQYSTRAISINCSFTLSFTHSCDCINGLQFALRVLYIDEYKVLVLFEFLITIMNISEERSNRNIYLKYTVFNFFNQIIPQPFRLGLYTKPK